MCVFVWCEGVCGVCECVVWCVAVGGVYECGYVVCGSMCVWCV